jgi:Tfp pilus assembly protein PilF
LLVAALLAPGVPAQVNVSSYTFIGTVRFSDGRGVPRAQIRVTSHTGFTRVTFTDDRGRFEIRDVPRGRYYVVATNPADPKQHNDAVEVDTGRSLSTRVLVNVFLAHRVDESTNVKESKSTISVGEAAQHVPRPAQKAFEQGLRHRANNQFDKALESFDRSIEIFPQYFQAYAERGHLRIGKAEYILAARDFGEALSLNDHYEPALRGSGMCKFQQGRFIDAVTDLERASALDSSIATTYLFLGIANASLDRREAAHRALEKSLSLDAGVAARARVHLANLYLQEDRLADAAAQLDAYLAVSPNAPDAAKLRAVRAQIDSHLEKR